MIDWLPYAERVPATVAGSSYIEGVPWRIVLHTTESNAFEAAESAYRGHGSWPHGTIDPRERIIRQHYPFTIAARALKNAPSGVETNRARAIQFEIVGFAGEAHRMFSGDDLNWTRDQVIGPVRQLFGIPPHAPEFFGADAGFTLATSSAPQRMSFQDWYRFAGVCGHQHVPENDHWDPGHIDIKRLIAQEEPSMSPPPPGLNAPVVDAAADPDGKGYYMLGADGGVFARSARMYGSAYGELSRGDAAVAIATHTELRGYWIVTKKGAVFSYGPDRGGRVKFHGGMFGKRLAFPIVDIVGTETGHGYWLFGADGGVFAFGDAEFEGTATHG